MGIVVYLSVVGLETAGSTEITLVSASQGGSLGGIIRV